MKILHISDTHGCHHKLSDLPEADVLIHSGDFTMTGSENEALDFLEWFCNLSYPNKIFICGNHDECMYKANIDGLDHNVHYLCNSGICINEVKFYGVPMFMGDCITTRQDRNYANIPTDTDVLITHSPAYGLLDFDDGISGEFINYGSKELLNRLTTLKLRVHLFGHIHRQHGILKQNGMLYSNGAIMNEDYSKLNSPNIIEI